MSTATLERPTNVKHSEYDPHVQRGMMLLDEERPGWEDELDLGTLNVADPHNCVLGQLYGEYQEGKDALGLSLGEAINHGFVAPTMVWMRNLNERLS